MRRIAPDPSRPEFHRRRLNTLAEREWLQLRRPLLTGANQSTETVAELLELKVPRRKQLHADLDRVVGSEKLNGILRCTRTPTLPEAWAIALALQVPLERFAAAWENSMLLALTKTPGVPPTQP